MLKRMLVMLLVTFLVITGLAYLKYLQVLGAIAMGKSFAPPPPAVSTLVLKAETYQPVIKAVGSMRAISGVTVSTDLAGIVSQIAFESGTPVKKGAVLLKMDTQQEEAQLRSNQARLDLARVDLERKQDLVAKKAIAPSDLDTAQSEMRRANAAVEESKALIGRKQIVAPFDGIIGIRQVNLGQYLNPGSMIATLQSLDPIYVQFALPEQNLGVVNLGRKLRLRAAGVEGEFEGKVTAINSMVDDLTRNVTMQGTIANPEEKLRPGMYANVDVLLDAQENTIAIPASAVVYAPAGEAVYALQAASAPAEPGQEAGKEVVLVPVKLGETRGDQIFVSSGLKAGDEIVVSGVFRLRPHQPVRVFNNSPKPSNDPNPHPANT